MAVHTAREIANWFLAWAEQSQASLTNLKLQKLLYYAQGHRLGETNSPLFDDDIEAWAHGPVVRSVYHDFKSYGAGEIDVDGAVGPEFDWDSYRDVEGLLVRVWNTYGKYAGWALRDRTHAEQPWKSTFERDAKYLTISQDKMRTFFASA